MMVSTKKGESYVKKDLYPKRKLRNHLGEAGNTGHIGSVMRGGNRSPLVPEKDRHKCGSADIYGVYSVGDLADERDAASETETSAVPDNADTAKRTDRGLRREKTFLDAARL